VEQLSAGKVPTFGYAYQYKDHLGNIRLTYMDSDNNGSIDASTEIISEKNYYPFGMTHSGYNNIVSANANSQGEKYQFNGKEFNEELGLDWHDFGARNYDASLGRWMNIDPLAEKYNDKSPYNYALNNPVFFVDPDGMAVKPPENHSYDDGTYWKDSEGVWQWNSAGAWEARGTKAQSSYAGSGDYSDPLDPNAKDDGSGNIEGETFDSAGEVAADNAKNHEGSTDWNYEVKKDEFQADTDKCNQFVCNQFEDAGVNSLRKDNGNIQDTGSLTNGPNNLGGFEIVATLDANGGDLSGVQVGDIVSGRRTSNGHVEIVIGLPDSNGNIPTIGAIGSTVRQGFRNLRVNNLPDSFNKITVRRYVPQE
jgi:RHS repeat-associated protein